MPIELHGYQAKEKCDRMLKEGFYVVLLCCFVVVCVEGQRLVLSFKSDKKKLAE
jgi:hypothetical protein